MGKWDNDHDINGEPEDCLDGVWEGFGENDHDMMHFFEEVFELGYERSLRAAVGFREYVEQIIIEKAKGETS